MVKSKSGLGILGLTSLASILCTQQAFAQQLQSFELENGNLLPGYTGIISSPFDGVAVYGNGDGVETSAQLSGIPGKFKLDIRGASSNSSSAGISVYLGDKKIGASSFSGTSASTSSIEFQLQENPSANTISFQLESDTGANDTFLDRFTLTRVGDIPPPPPAPVLPSQGSYESGEYRNMFSLLGYSQAEVDARVQAVYEQLFHGDQENEAIFVPVGSDMGYIWDVGNNDVRSEGMSYGMMMAVQMGRQDDFNRLWKWAHTYSLNKSGNNKGFFAWQVSTSGNILDANPAPDGEEYFITALFFASRLWGDGSGIYNYKAQANQILDDIYGNGQTRYNNQGELEEFSLFNHAERQIVFSPATPSDRNWTDPSYHLPAFYELWARWADDNNLFWAELAETSRDFFKTTAHPTTGLSPDYAYFDGSPHGDFQNWKDTFQYDAWRTISNAAMDYSWWKKDEWQNTWAERLQAFFKSEGIDSYSSLYELNGVPYENNSDHSPGLVAMNAVASLASDEPEAHEFVQALWNTEVPTGQWRYYDGSLYMFGMLAASGKYRIICPAGECDAVTPTPTPSPTPTPTPTPSPTPAPTPTPTPTPSPTPGSLISEREIEDGTFTPSYRETDAEWAPLYSNGESIEFSESLAAGSYSLQIVGKSSNGSAAGISVYVGGNKVGETSFTSTTGETKTISFTTTNAASSLKLVLETDVGQNDTLLDSYALYSGSATPTPSPTPSPTPTPSPSPTPSCEAVTVQSEDYNNFYDTSSGNAGGAYRNDDVDLQSTSDSGGGYNLGWTASGEWLEYSINLAPGNYNIESRVASNPGNGQYSLSIDGSEIVGAQDVPSTGGWQNWITQTQSNVQISGSSQTLRMDIQNGNFNSNWIKFIPNNCGSDGATSATVQAEDYINFYDSDSGNNGGAYRSDDVDIENTSDNGGGYNVGWTTSGEWLEYEVDLAAGNYTLEMRVASLNGGGQYSVEIDGISQISNTQVSSTGGWQNWTSIYHSLSLGGGSHTIRVNIGQGGFNLNWLSLNKN